MLTRLILGCFALGLALNLIGCTAPQRERPARTADFAGERILDADPTAVRAAAARVLRQHFRIDQQASTPTQLVSWPEEVSGRGETTSVRDVLTLSPNRQRRIAEIRIIQEGTGVLVQCRVQLQRLDTSERAAFAAERGDDRPSERSTAPRESAAPATEEEWIDITRDRNTERTLLDAIQSHFPATQPTP